MSNALDWYAQIPPKVRSILLDCEAWIVGSGAKWALQMIEEKPRDLDIIVPPARWSQACRVLGAGTKGTINTYGGLKVELEGTTCDIWPAHLEEYFSITPKTQEHWAFRWKPRCVILEGEHIQ